MSYYGVLPKDEALWEKWLEDRQHTEGYEKFEFSKLGYQRKQKEIQELEAMIEGFIKRFQDRFDCLGFKGHVHIPCQRCVVNEFAAEFLKYQNENRIEKPNGSEIS